jgi:hypothetical protein
MYAFARGWCPIPLLAALVAGCSQDDAKLIDVPRKDIPKEMYNKPIPPEAFKTMPGAMRKQAEKKDGQMFSHTVEQKAPEKAANP